MIAEAVRVAYPTAHHISVDLQTIRLTDPDLGVRYTYLTPRSSQVALARWDAGIKPEPWDFQLRNGQTTLAGSRHIRQGDLEGEAKRLLRKARLSKPEPSGVVPDRVGGRPPPSSGYSKRRAFGLRGLEM